MTRSVEEGEQVAIAVHNKAKVKALKLKRINIKGKFVEILRRSIYLFIYLSFN